MDGIGQNAIIWSFSIRLWNRKEPGNRKKRTKPPQNRKWNRNRNRPILTPNTPGMVRYQVIGSQESHMPEQLHLAFLGKLHQSTQSN